MSSIIIFVIIVLIVIGLISKFVKKTREVRASFRDTFGGGREETLNNATNKLSNNMKDRMVPEWALDEAAKELTKYNLADSLSEAQVKLMEILRNENVQIADLPKDMAIPAHTSKEAATQIVSGYIKRLNAKNYKAGKGFTNNDQKLIRQSKYAYFFAVDEASFNDAVDAVDYLVDQWKVDVEDGKIV